MSSRGYISHGFFFAGVFMWLRFDSGQVYGAGDQTLKGLPSGRAGVRQTLVYMRDWVREYRVSPVVRQLAINILRSVPSKNWLAEAEAIRRWVAGNIRYTRDVAGVETLQTPEVTLKMRAGDCDDQATLIAAMLESVGFETRIVAIGARDGDFDHVYVEAAVPGRGWLSVETTEPVTIGWEPKYRSRMVVNV